MALWVHEDVGAVQLPDNYRWVVERCRRPTPMTLSIGVRSRHGEERTHRAVVWV